MAPATNYRKWGRHLERAEARAEHWPRRTSPFPYATPSPPSRASGAAAEFELMLMAMMWAPGFCGGAGQLTNGRGRASLRNATQPARARLALDARDGVGGCGAPSLVIFFSDRCPMEHKPNSDDKATEIEK